MGRTAENVKVKKEYSLIDMACQTMHIRRLRNGSFDDKLQHLIRTILEERMTAIHQTTVIKKTKYIKKRKPVLDKFGIETKMKEIVEEEEIVKERVALSEEDRKAVFIKYRVACEQLKREFDEAKKGVSMSRAKPHRDVINAILTYIVDNPDAAISDMDLLKIINSTHHVSADLEYSVKAAVNNNNLKSYNDRVRDETERRFYLFKASSEARACKEVYQFRLLKEHPEAWAEFNEHIRLNPIKVDVINPPKEH